ncbi:Lysophospholipid acyltransferase LPEAT1 [Bienertia sinuspersici]
MDSELKDLSNNHNSHEYQQQDQIDNGDLPLLKSNSAIEQNPNSQTPENQITAAELEEMEKKFAAYVRCDTYGPMGCGELPIAEKILLGIAMLTLMPLRVVIGMVILVVYYFICKVCTLFSMPYQEGEVQQQQEDYAHLGGWRREVIVHCGRFLSRALLFTFGFYWIPQASRVYDGEELNDESDSRDQLEKPERPGVVVSNHVSYLDILFHMSSSFPSFVAKTDTCLFQLAVLVYETSLVKRSVGKLPLIGLMRLRKIGRAQRCLKGVHLRPSLRRCALVAFSKCLGCVYVQREDKSSDFKGVSGVVTERIKEAHDSIDAPLMLIFPGYDSVA